MNNRTLLLARTVVIGGLVFCLNAQAELKGTNATAYSWDDSSNTFKNSNATIMADGKWHSFFSTLQFDNNGVDPAAADQSNGVVQCSTVDTDGNGLVGTSTPWAGTLRLSLDQSDTGVDPNAVANAFQATRCWELAVCDREGDGTGSFEGADLSVLPRYHRFTVDITGSEVCQHPNGNTAAGWEEVAATNGFITLLAQDVTRPTSAGGATQKIDTDLYVNLDRDCDGFIDDGDGVDGGNNDPHKGDLSLIGSGGDGRMPLPVGGNDPQICFFAEGLKPDFTATPLWSSGNIQARITAPIGSSGEKTVNHSVDAATVGDVGDLPISYTEAGHIVNAGDPYLGSTTPADDPDTETTYLASNDALGDDTDGDNDENGVILPAASDADGDGDDNVYTSTVTANNNSGADAMLCGWFDMDQSGDFDNSPNTSTAAADPESGSAADAGERSCVAVPDGTTDGTFSVAWTIPETLRNAAGTFFFRYRITTDPDAFDANLLSPTGTLSSGEIEDHAQDITSLPVTLNRVKARLAGDGIDFKWGTVSETATVGFNFWGQVDGQWLQLNEQLFVNNATDSTTPQNYRHTVPLPPAGEVDAVSLSSVDTDGSEHFFGPFAIGSQYGQASTPDPIPWDGIQAELDQRMRGKGYAKKGGKWRKPPDRAQGRLAATASARAETGTSLIHLETQHEGIHRVSYRRLLEAGFDLTGVPAVDIAVTHKGKPVPRHVDDGGGKGFGPGGYVDFYAAPVDEAEARYTRTNVYQLHVDRALVRDSESMKLTGNPGGAPAYYIETVERDVNVTYSVTMPGHEPWYEHRLLGIPGALTAKASVDLNVDHLAANVADQRIRVRAGVVGNTYFSGGGPDHHVQVFLNDELVADVTNDGIVQWDIAEPVPAGALRDGANTIRIEVPGVEGHLFDLIYGDTYAIDYPREFVARDDVLSFTESAESFEIRGFTSNDIVAYALDDGTLNRLQVRSGRDGGAFMARLPGTAGGDARYWVSATGALPEPEVIDAGGPGDLLTPVADYVIVSHANFIDRLQEADDFIGAKQGQGYSVKIVDVADIYNQYGHGIAVPGAIRAYLQAQDALSPVRQVLIVGGATSDPLDYGGEGSIDFVPTYFARAGRTIFQAPADGLIVDLYGDGGLGTEPDGIPDKSIGRWPVRTVVELDTIIDKTLQYQQSMASQRSALLVAGATDSRFPTFSGQTERVAEKLATPDGAPWTDLTRVFVDDFGSVGAAQSVLKQGFNDGNAVTLFSGHASTSAWTYQGLLNWQVAQSLGNTDKPTLIGTMSCYTSYFVSPTTDTLGHQLLLSGNRGAALIHGAATLSGFSRNEALLGRSMSAMSGGASVGEAVLEARRGLGPNYSEVVTNWSLLGDPSLSFSQ